ncbi:MAG: hypothetical protein HOV87_32825 [Catenulispora sp.]|nr:hypothetical protein [Catenulispora sp.]
MSLQTGAAPERHAPFWQSWDSWQFRESVWSHGDEVYQHLCEHLLLQERLQPYLQRLAEEAQQAGLPPVRPLFVEFPADAVAWEVDDQFLLGADILIAPVAEADARHWFVYLPEGADWIDAASGQVREGGWAVQVCVPVDRLVVFVRRPLSP